MLASRRFGSDVRVRLESVSTETRSKKLSYLPVTVAVLCKPANEINCNTKLQEKQVRWACAPIDQHLPLLSQVPDKRFEHLIC
jgi:hypothetical protein